MFLRHVVLLDLVIIIRLRTITITLNQGFGEVSLFDRRTTVLTIGYQPTIKSELRWTLERITLSYNAAIGKNMVIILVRAYDLPTSLLSVIIGVKILNETARDMLSHLMNL